MAAKRSRRAENCAPRKPDVIVSGASNAAYQADSDEDRDRGWDWNRDRGVDGGWDGDGSASDGEVVWRSKLSGCCSVSQKDKGYAWVIAVVCLISSVLSSFGLSVSGVLLLELADTFPEASTFQLSVAATTQMSVTLILCMFTGPLVPRFGSRALMMAGSILSATSIFCTNFSPTISIFTTIYLLSAIGTSCMHMSTLVICTKYFDQHKSLALALLLSGYSVSYFFWPPFCTVVFEQYGFGRGCMILGGFQLLGCFLAALMRPFQETDVIVLRVDEKPTAVGLLSSERPLRSVRSDPSMRSLPSMPSMRVVRSMPSFPSIPSESSARLLPSEPSKPSTPSIPPILPVRPMPSFPSIPTKSPERLLTLEPSKPSTHSIPSIAPVPPVRSLRSHLLEQCAVFKNKTYWGYLCVLFIGFMAFMFCPAYCPTMGIGLETTYTNAAFLVSIHGVCSGVSRIVMGIIGDWSWMRDNRLLISITGFTVAGVAKTISVTVTAYVYAVLFVVVDGFATGAFTCVLYTIVTDIVEEKVLATATGFMTTIYGLSLFLGTLLNGWLVGHYDSLYEPAMILGSMQIFAGMLATCLYWFIRCRNRKNTIITITIP